MMFGINRVTTASRLSIIVFLGAVTALTGCTESRLAYDDTYEPLSHYENYPIAVVKGPIKLSLSSSQGSLQASQANAIASFALDAKTAKASKITISRPSAGGASAKVASSAYRVLVSSGIPRDMVVQTTHRASSRDPVQLSFVRSVAVSKECGDWSSDWAFSKEHGPRSNSGCSIQHNIAAMVNNPDDLVNPRAETPALAATRMQGQEIARISRISDF